MPAEKTDAIVLRVIDFSETSCVVTLMTRDFGKITALAKGARRRKSPFEAALDLLSVCRIVFLRKTSGAMDLLTEAKLQRRFRSASTDLDRLYVGYYILELLSAMTDHHDPHPEVFELADRTIALIDGVSSLGSSFDLLEVLIDFELRLLMMLGHTPMLTQCVGCGREKTDDTRVSFGLSQGGILCSGCRIGKQNVISLSSAGLVYLREKMEKSKQTEIDFASEVAEGTARNRGEVKQLVNKYISHLLGYQPRLHKLVNNLDKRKVS